MSKNEKLGLRLMILSLLLVILAVYIFAGWFATLIALIFCAIGYTFPLGVYYLSKDLFDE